MNFVHQLLKQAMVAGPAALTKPAEDEPKAKLDAAGSQDDAGKGADEGKGDEGKGDEGKGSEDSSLMDAAGAAYVDQDIALKAAGAVNEWAETTEDDLDAGETLATRLMMLLLGIADIDGDGEINESEQEVVDAAIENAFDYLTAKGVSEADAEALLGDWDDAVGQRVHELILSRLPDGEDATSDDMNAFAFADGDGAQESMFDSVGAPVLDAVYKKRLAIRAGKKVRINKRISGTVRLSAKQKLAVRKMLRKTHSAGAQLRRAKSNRIRKQTIG